MGIVVLGVIAVGAMLLAVLFGQLTKRIPNSDGGLLRLLPHEFGDFVRLPWWAGATGSRPGRATPPSCRRGCSTVDALFGFNHITGLREWGIAMVGLWVPALVNLVGIRQMPGSRTPTVVLKFLPLLFVGLVGVVLRRQGQLRTVQRIGGSLYSGIGGSPPVWPSFSFIGVEAAAMTAKRVENPASTSRSGLAARHGPQRRPVPAGHGGGDGPGAPTNALINNGSPFVDAFQTIFNGAGWAGKFIAAVAVVSGIGALNGWTLIVDRDVPGPSPRTTSSPPSPWTDSKGTAWFGIVVGTALPSLLMLWRYTTTSA